MRHDTTVTQSEASLSCAVLNGAKVFQYRLLALGAGQFQEPALPTVVAHMRDVEHLFAIRQRRLVSAILTKILRAGDER